MKRLLPCLIGLLAAFSALAVDVPYLSGRVVDNAEILKAETKRNLAARLKAHEQETSEQIAVLTVPSLEGESIESYAEQVFNTWKLGQKGKDNGVLVLVAPSERRMRIEVGYGLEGTLTDVAASRIVRNVMTPRFKEGNFDAGIEQGVAAVIGQLTGGAAPAADAPPVAERKSDSFFEGPDLPSRPRCASSRGRRRCCSSRSRSRSPPSSHASSRWCSARRRCARWRIIRPSCRSSSTSGSR